MAKLEVQLLIGEQSKQWLADVTALVERLEKGVGQKVKGTSIVDEETDEAIDEPTDTMTEDEDTDFTPKKKSTKKAGVEFSDEYEEGEPDADPAPKKKAKKLTIEDVNAACKAYATENGVKKTKALLKKKFGSESLSDLEEDQWAAVIAAMKG
jgi:hypothetical protein